MEMARGIRQGARVGEDSTDNTVESEEKDGWLHSESWKTGIWWTSHEQWDGSKRFSNSFCFNERDYRNGSFDEPN
jgi:hypothetical protein